ncbi:transcriptional regulator [Microcoleus sp. FACHB-831]|uniref:helix-turn-helix domain-containing transcriptional regulator n=1 Tax=Microcoleus sp. FACHB-831 TaxID=2692827 RepID=UPI0016864AE4|nr:transcriptional regulator [Microcoleus sp. FACHB-831]MBD1922197.1 transcriptional regulator [Microcoleus sp. FACHB-831]
MPKSVSYHPYLISRLKDPSYAAVYLETHLEEKGPEPELLELALSNVAEALGERNMSEEEAKMHREKLSQLLSQRGSDAIYNLGNWLNALGLKLTVTVCDEAKDSLINSASGEELTV